jgi:hypothetical protein
MDASRLYGSRPMGMPEPLPSQGQEPSGSSGFQQRLQQAGGQQGKGSSKLELLRARVAGVKGGGQPQPSGQAAAAHGISGADVIREMVLMEKGEAASLYKQAMANPGAMGPALADPSNPMGRAVLEHRLSLMGLVYLQYGLSRGKHSLISNMLKARHDTQKNSVGNMR